MTTSLEVQKVPKTLVDADYAQLISEGYIVFERLIDAKEIAEIRAECVPLLGPIGRNSFEGFLTQRTYNLLPKTRVFDKLIEHPRILSLLDRILLPNYLLSQAQVIKILPGQSAQLLHCDDGGYRVPRPRPALGVATVWALDEFTRENGATQIVPRSHLWGNERRPTREEAHPCAMPPGSAILFLGTLWHGGGVNRSEAARLAVTCQYNEPWLRQQENFLLEVSPEVAATLPENILRMIGYSIYPPFFGMVDGMHPKRLLNFRRRI
jgi:ectoine hydroxylase-related dioxygenase (phytanoyl-CoA dioxygenase family)